MKKIIIFFVISIILFASLAFVSSASEKEKVKGNPYKKEQLQQATIDQLNDPLYQNQITPDVLAHAIENKNSFVVLFYKSDCVHCHKLMPLIVPLAQEIGVDLKKLNLLEFPDEWSHYRIDMTPTLVWFKDGKEYNRLEGDQNGHSVEEYKSWLMQCTEKN